MSGSGSAADEDDDGPGPDTGGAEAGWALPCESLEGTSPLEEAVDGLGL